MMEKNTFYFKLQKLQIIQSFASLPIPSLNSTLSRYNEQSIYCQFDFKSFSFIYNMYVRHSIDQKRKIIKSTKCIKKKYVHHQKF